MKELLFVIIVCLLICSMRCAPKNQVKKMLRDTAMPLLTKTIEDAANLKFGNALVNRFIKTTAKNLGEHMNEGDELTNEVVTDLLEFVSKQVDGLKSLTKCVDPPEMATPLNGLIMALGTFKGTVQMAWDQLNNPNNNGPNQQTGDRGDMHGNNGHNQQAGDRGDMHGNNGHNQQKQTGVHVDVQVGGGHGFGQGGKKS